MPYIGNSHVVGDHINNFKVLDDISSYTETFDGSSTNVVSTSDETLRIIGHRFVQGQRVTYNNGGGSNIGGLSSGTAYYISFDTANTIKLATSLVHANNGTLINLSSVGGGTSHTLTAAFDGTNTKFKLTHNGGESGRFNNATQLQVAINNVLQRPNSDPDNFTEGFAIELGNKIVFQTAPSSNDVFWGSIIANSLPTFDIDATAIDNFTGDGSTTDFTLSRIPPNSASIIVTINGVFQHISDTTTARAYSLDASVVTFTSAPASGDEIQVRHTGFRGATSDSVTGFYGRTGNVVLGSGDNIIVGGINATGIITTPQFNVGSNIQLGNAGVITATSYIGSGAALTGIDATAIKDSGGNVKIQAEASGAVYTGIHTFSGNVSIGGTLTYEDVTNIDSVGLITARDGIKVGTGVTIESNGQAEIAGITTFYKDVHIKSATNRLYVGANDRISLIADPSHSYLRINGGHFQIHNNNFGVRSYDGNGSIMLIYAPVNDGSGTGGPQLWHYHGSGIQIKRLSTTTSGVNIVGTTTSTQLAISGVSTFTGNIDANGDLDVDGHTNLDNVSISGVTTASTINSTGNIEIDVDNGEFRCGAGGDFKISHNGSLNILRSDYPTVFRNAANNETLAILTPNGSVALYHDNTKRLETTSTGVTVTGTVVATGADINGDLDVDGHTNLDNVSVSGITTFTGNTFVNDSFTINDTGSSTPLTITGNFGTGDSVYIQNNTSGGHIQFGLRVNDSDGNHHRAYITAERGTGATANGKLSIVARRGNGTDFGWIIDAGVGIQANYNVIPETDSTHDLGTSSVRWANVYADTLYGDGSNLTGISGVTINNNADNRVITGSGTAATLNGESALTFDGSKLLVNATSSAAGNLVVKSADGSSNQVWVIGRASDNTGSVSFRNNGDSAYTGRIEVEDTNGMIFQVGSSDRLQIDTAGQVLPGADDAQNLGSSTKRWKNIYAADMHFSNEGKTNDVDGTWGDWTLQEGEDSVFMINNRTGKKYAITMKEVN